MLPRTSDTVTALTSRFGIAARGLATSRAGMRRGEIACMDMTRPWDRRRYTSGPIGRPLKPGIGTGSVRAKDPSIDQPAPQRESHQLAGIVQVQLLHHPPAVRLDCVNTQTQLSRDILIRLPFRDHLEHLAFARRQ